MHKILRFSTLYLKIPPHFIQFSETKKTIPLKIKLLHTNTSKNREYKADGRTASKNQS